MTVYEVMKINASQIKILVDNFQTLEERKTELTNGFALVEGKNTRREISIMKNIQDLNNKIVIVEKLLFGSDTLNDKEETILDLKLDGCNLNEIASYFAIDRKTVTRYLKRIYEKLSSSY